MRDSGKQKLSNIEGALLLKKGNNSGHRRSLNRNRPPGSVPGGRRSLSKNCHCDVCAQRARTSPRPAKFPPKGGDERSLAEFAPAGANKVGSFFAAACTWRKILLAERSVDRPASGPTRREAERIPSFGCLHPNETKFSRKSRLPARGLGRVLLTPCGGPGRGLRRRWGGCGCRCGRSACTSRGS